MTKQEAIMKLKKMHDEDADKAIGYYNEAIDYRLKAKTLWDTLKVKFYGYEKTSEYYRLVAEREELEQKAVASHNEGQKYYATAQAYYKALELLREVA